MLQEIPEIYEVVVVTYDKFPYETGNYFLRSDNDI